MFPVLFGNNELIEKQRFVFTIPFVTNVLGRMARLGPKQTCNASFRIMRKVCHLYSWYFTTQGSDTHFPRAGKWAASERWQRKLSKIQCQVSADGTLKCLPLYRKTQGAEQKQEGEGMYKVLWYKRFSRRDENATRHCTQFIWGWLFIPERPCPCVPWGRMMEEVIDSSHHLLWEGQTLPFPFSVIRVIILTFVNMHRTAISVPHWWWSIGVQH